MHTLVGFHRYIHVFEAVVAKFEYSDSKMLFVYHNVLQRKFGMYGTVIIICADTKQTVHCAA